MSDEVTVIMSVGSVNENPTIRVCLQETIVGECTGDLESVLLDAAVRLRRMSTQATEEITKQVAGMRRQALSKPGE